MKPSTTDVNSRLYFDGHLYLTLRFNGHLELVPAFLNSFYLNQAL